MIILYFIGGGQNTRYTGKTTGTVLSSIKTKWEDEEEGTSAEYRITVAYSVDGAEYEGTIEMGSNRLKGESVDLAYDPDDPGDVLPAYAINGLFIIPLIGGIFIFLGIILDLNALRKQLIVPPLPSETPAGGNGNE